MRELRWPRLWLAVWLLGWLLAIVLSLLDPSDLPPPPGSDKLGHLLAYAMLAAWAAMIFRNGWPMCVAVLALAVLGCGLELAQGWLTTTRAMEPLDAVANITGAVMGWTLTRTRWAGLLPWLEVRLLAWISRSTSPR